VVEWQAAKRAISIKEQMRELSPSRSRGKGNDAPVTVIPSKQALLKAIEQASGKW